MRGLLNILIGVSLLSPLYATENELELPPNPVSLQADWPTYLDVEPEILETRIKKIKQVIESLQNQVESQKIKEQAEKYIVDIQTHLNALLLLKKNKVKEDNFAWLPKERYDLGQYLALSDQIRELEREINQKNTELQRSNSRFLKQRQHLQNEFAAYLTLSQNTKEKYIQGLKVLALNSRSLYLDEEVKLLKRLIASNLRRLEQLQNEMRLINGALNLEFDPNTINEKKAELTTRLSSVHEELLGLETESIQTKSSDHSFESIRVTNQKLTQATIKETLLLAKLLFIDAQTILFQAKKSPRTLKDLDSTKSYELFIDETRVRIDAWEEVTASEIDQLSQVLSKVNTDRAEDVKSNNYEESLNLSLSNMTLIDALSRELHHIELVLELIDKNIVIEQYLLDRFTFHIKSLWNDLVVFFEVWLYYSLFDIGGIPITVKGLIKAALIIFISFWLSKFVRRSIKKLAKSRGKLVEPTLYTFSRILHYLILLIGTLIALSTLGLTLRNMALILGALGIGIGFGLQNIVNNFLCGLAILFERNLKIGDYVELESGLFGKIIEVNVQNSTLHTFDGLDVLVPNSSLIGSNVVNWTKKDPFQRIHVPFSVAYGTDPDLVSQVVCSTANKVLYTIRGVSKVRDPEVWLVEFGASSLNFELIVWVNIFTSRGRNAMKAAYLLEILKAFDANGIHIPFPQRDLYLKSMPEKIHEN